MPVSTCNPFKSPYLRAIHSKNSLLTSSPWWSFPGPPVTQHCPTSHTLYVAASYLRSDRTLGLKWRITVPHHLHSRWQPPISGVTSHTLYVAASYLMSYIAFTQCGSLTSRELHHILSMWQPHIPWVTSHSLNVALSAPKSNPLKIIPWTQNHEYILWTNSGILYGRNISLKKKD